ncbi:MAG: hypothetical protein ACRELY_08615 [Polyangiaceae bacterium]
MTELLEPWKSVLAERKAGLERELARELSPEHTLAGHTVHAIAARCDCDDVLFEVPGIGYAVVHLSWPREREHSPNYPTTHFFSSFEDWCERRMKLDHRDYTLGDEST